MKDKYRKTFLLILGINIVLILIPFSLIPKDLYNSNVNYTDSICFDCNVNQKDTIGVLIFTGVIIIVVIIMFVIMSYKDKKKKKDSEVINTPD